MHGPELFGSARLLFGPSRPFGWYWLFQRQSFPIDYLNVNIEAPQKNLLSKKPGYISWCLARRSLFWYQFESISFSDEVCWTLAVFRLQNSPALEVAWRQLESLRFLWSVVSAAPLQVTVQRCTYTEPVCAVCERQLRKHQTKPARHEACRRDVCYQDSVPTVQVWPEANSVPLGRWRRVNRQRLLYPDNIFATYCSAPLSRGWGETVCC